MLFAHSHGPDGHDHHDDHDDDHDHDHDHDDHDHDHDHHGGGEVSRLGKLLRAGFAALIVAAAVTAACVVMVPSGEAVVIARFGNPVRVLAKPGLAWKLPVPVETEIPVDLRLHSTSTALQDVGTQDGLRVLVQAYVAWQVPNDPQHIRQFLRSVRNQPDEAARQLRSFVGAALHIVASNFAFADLVNTDPAKVRLDAFEQQLQAQIAIRMLDVYGIEIHQVGLERLILPDEPLVATVARMKAERATVAAQRTADGLRRAAQVRADADRDGRKLVAQAHEQAAQIEADAELAAASVYAGAYQAQPELYATLRSLDTLSTIVGRNTRLVLRTDAAPFRVLVDGPLAAPAPGAVLAPAGSAKP